MKTEKEIKDMIKFTNSEMIGYLESKINADEYKDAVRYYTGYKNALKWVIEK